MDGNSVASGTSSSTVKNVAESIRIARKRGEVAGTYSYAGYIDEVRISKGIARWVGNFTPPIRSYCGPDYAAEPRNIVAWWDGDDVTDTIVNDRKSTHDATMNGTISVVTGKIGNAINLSGNNSKLTVPDDNELDFTTSMGISLLVKSDQAEPANTQTIVSKGQRKATLDVSSFVSFDAGSVGTNTKGYRGGVFDGKYIYFIPSNYGSSYHGKVLRYDTTLSFTSGSSWNSFDAGSVGANTKGYIGGVFDGKYIYFVPFIDGSSQHGKVLRYDTTDNDSSFALNYQKVINSGLGGESLGPSFIIQTDSGTYHTTSKTTLDNGWHHLVAQYTGSQIELYVDGSLVSSTAATGTITNSSAEIIIGALYGGKNFFKGSIDELQLYSVTLTAEEIADIYTKKFLSLDIALHDPSLSFGTDSTPTFRVSGVADGYTIGLYKSLGTGCDVFLKYKVATGSTVDITTDALSEGLYTMYTKVENDGSGGQSNCSTEGASYAYDTSSPGVDSNVVLMIHGDGTGQNFLDSSYSQHTVSAIGTGVQHSTSAFKFGDSSLWFPGNDNNYLKISDNISDFDFGSGNFTIDFWLQASEEKQYQYLLVRWEGDVLKKLWMVRADENKITFLARNPEGSNFINFTGVTPIVPDGSFHHIAIVRSGSSVKLFIDGIQDGEQTGVSGSVQTHSSVPLQIGQYSTSYDYNYKGYIDEIRISKGIARWTENFTVPFRPYYDLPAEPTISLQEPSSTTSNDATPTFRVSGVQNGYTVGLYKSTGSGCDTLLKEVVASGTTVDITTDTLTDGTYSLYVKVVQNEGGYSSSCSAVGADYVLDLTAPDPPSALTLVDPTPDSGSPYFDSTPTFNMSGVVSGDTIGLYFNSSCTNSAASGTASSTTINLTSSNITSDGTHTYYVDATDPVGNKSSCSTANVAYEFAFVCTLDDSNTTLLVHSNTINGSTIFTDSAASSHTLTKNGNVIHSTDQKKFGSSSIYFDGTGGFLNISNHDDFKFGNGDFTVEAFVYFSELSTSHQVPMSFWTGGGAFNKAWNFDANPNLSVFSFQVSSDGSYEPIYIDSTTIPQTGQWYHIAIERSGDTFRLYINGTKEASGTYTGSVYNTTADLMIGGRNNTGKMNGYIDEIRISKTARYNTDGSFTVPTTPFCDVTPATPAIVLHEPSSSYGIDNTPTFRIYGVTKGYTVGIYRSTGSGCDTLLKQAVATGSTVDITTDVLADEGTHTYYAKVESNAEGIASGCSVSGVSYELDSSVFSVTWEGATTDFTFDGADIITSTANRTIYINNIISGDVEVSLNFVYADDDGVVNGGGCGDALSFGFFDASNVGSLNQNSALGMPYPRWIVYSSSDYNANFQVRKDNTQVNSFTPLSSGDQIKLRRTDGNFSLIVNDSTYHIWDTRFLGDLHFSLGTGCGFKITNFSMKKLSVSDYCTTNDTDTVLLIQSDTTNETASITENSLSGHIVTKNGDAHNEYSDGIAKFGQSSIYFDGTGDYLSITESNSNDFNFGTSAFTVDFWFRLGAGDFQIISMLMGGTGEANRELYIGYMNTKMYTQMGDGSWLYVGDANEFNDNNWHHYALVREGTSTDQVKIYMDGVQRGTMTRSGNVNFSGDPGAGGKYIGTDTGPNNLTGYLDEIRISRTKRWTSNFSLPTKRYCDVTNTADGSETVLLIHSDTANESGSITDNSVSKHSITKNGDVHHEFSNGITKFGQSSIYFDGVGDYLSIDDNVDWDLSSEDFTIDFWVYFTKDLSSNQVFMGQSTSGFANYWYFWRHGNGLFRFEDNTNGIVVSGTPSLSISTGNWYHVAVTRTGNQWKLYLNGTIFGSAASNVTMPDIVDSLTIGTLQNTSYFGGYMDEIHITKGISRWNSNFNPPTKQYDEITCIGIDDDTKLLISSDNEPGDPIVDTSAMSHTNDITLYGDIAHSTTVTPPYGSLSSSSIYFDGDGDYIDIAHHTDWEFVQNEPFVIDFYIRLDGTLTETAMLINHGGQGQYITDFNGWGIYLHTNGGMYFNLWNTGNQSQRKLINSAMNLVPGQWYHLAVVKDDSSVLRLFKDGVKVAEASDMAFVPPSSNFPLRIGRAPPGDDTGATKGQFKGYLTNLRILKGTDRGWSSNFNPPTIPYCEAETEDSFTGPCPSGFIPVPGETSLGTPDFCVAKYEMRNDGSGNAVSQAGGTPYVEINPNDAFTKCSNMSEAGFESGTFTMITNPEWMTIARNIEQVASNWSGGSMGSGTLARGWSPNSVYGDSWTNTAAASSAGSSCLYNSAVNACASSGNHLYRRTLVLSNSEEIWDFSGNVLEWVDWDVTGSFTSGPINCPASWNEFSTSCAALSDGDYKPAGGFTSAQGTGWWLGGGGGAMLRGGYWNDGWYAGAFALLLNSDVSSSHAFTGFRCVYRP